MNKEKSRNTEIDDLIKQVLKDDLPPEVKNRMERHFIQFRKTIERSYLSHRMNIRMVWRRLFRPRAWQWAHWILKKEILAFSSIIMVALGGILHISGHRSALAESVSLLRTSISVSDHMLRTGSMECLVQVPAENGKSLAYSIHWLSSNMIRVDVQKTEKISKTLWISDEDITLFDHVKNSIHKVKSIEQISDPLFQPVMEFLSPTELAEHMYARWEPKQYEQHHEQEQGTFTFANHEEKTLLQMSVDLNTYLPINIRKFLPSSQTVSKERKLVIKACFIWNQPISPQIMIPKNTKRIQCV